MRNGVPSPDWKDGAEVLQFYLALASPGIDFPPR